MLSSSEQEAIVKDAASAFPGEFGLRAFPGDVFRVDLRDSYYSEHEHAVLLYTHVKRGDQWMAFCKGTVAELRREIVKA